MFYVELDFVIRQLHQLIPIGFPRENTPALQLEIGLRHIRPQALFVSTKRVFIIDGNYNTWLHRLQEGAERDVTEPPTAIRNYIHLSNHDSGWLDSITQELHHSYSELLREFYETAQRPQHTEIIYRFSLYIKKLSVSYITIKDQACLFGEDNAWKDNRPVLTRIKVLPQGWNWPE